uniref:FAD-dependent oxidoreductase n=1 Tax=Microbacterium sp. CPCC 204701 TaxID=2493084 RepID=UPI001F0C3664
AATSAGVCAAVAAARAGSRAVLLEPGRHVGGMTSGGLGYTGGQGLAAAADGETHEFVLTALHSRSP